jgi:hypothetical protein
MSKLVDNVNKEISRVESKLDKENANWLKVGDSKVQGCGPDGKGSAGLAAQQHSEAAKIIDAIKPVTR